MSSQTIICGVTCACAPNPKQQSTNTTSGNVACDAKSSCKLNGKCDCGEGVCKASKAKAACALKDSCNCAAGVCEAVDSCVSRGTCDCSAGTCAKAATATSA